MYYDSLLTVLTVEKRWAQIENIIVDLPTDSGLFPQTYTLYAIQAGYVSSDPNEVLIQNATWFYESDS